MDNEAAQAELIFTFMWKFWTRLIFRRIEKFCLRLEKRLTRAAFDLQRSNEGLYTALVQLAIKALVSYRAALSLRRSKLYEESEASWRIFMESWVYLMDFVWSPDIALLEWWKNPTRPLNEKKLLVKQRVEEQFSAKLKLEPRQKLSFVKFFDHLSNTAVHPTRGAVESAWRSAAERCGLKYGGDDAARIENLRTFSQAADNFRIVIHLAWFMRFLRNYLFVLKPINEHVPKPSLFEAWLEKWPERAPEFVQTIFNQAEMQYAYDKKQERARKATNPEQDT
jgi:hypothetical protein